MAVTNLRDYLRAIEELVDSGQVEDALAHCRQVLKTYPKHVDTYRLMGKAYLESKRHSEATDLFQRVLSSVPDDFVSHIGMSIIREDEGNQDAAIWHMERAFESQPSNRAVQDELRRLYGKREGYEPPKVRLTRGALARMYSHGDLHNQAIAELRNALAEDPQRPDLQVLLAEMYFKTNQHAQAIDVCTQIIQKLPFCLYANRVMVDILRASQRESEAAPYQNRASELDPYAAQVSTLHDVEQVPAESIAIDSLEIETKLVLGAPKSWNGAEAGPAAYEKEDLPDWLSAESADPVADGEALSGLEPGDDLPPLDGETPAPEPFAGKSGALQPDQIPDWLRELRPGTGMLPNYEPEPEPEDPAQRSWTDELKRAGFKPTGPLDMDEIQPPAAEPPQETPPEPPAAIGAVLATSELHWLDTPLGEEGEAPAEDAAEPVEDSPPPAPELPEWLQELNEGDIEPSLRPATGPLGQSPEDTQPITPQPAASEPDWLDEFKAASTSAPESALEAEESAAAEDVTDSRMEAGQEDAQPTEYEVAARLSELQPPALSQEDQDNLGWLENLAAKRGAAEDELLTTPEERQRARPEWLQASEAEAGQAAQPQSETLDWLDELAAAAGTVAAATDASGDDPSAGQGEEDTPFQSGPQEEDTPDWLRRLSADMQSRERSVTGSIAPRPLEDAPDWLSDLRREEGGEPAAEEAEPLVPFGEPTGSLSWLDEEDSDAGETAPAPSVEPTWVPANQLEHSPEVEPEPEAEPLAEGTADFSMPGPQETAPQPEPEAQPEPLAESQPDFHMEAEPEPAADELQPVAASQPQAARQRSRRLDPEQIEERLAQARQALSYGNIEDAVDSYGFFLRRRLRLDEVIADLGAALRRFPRRVELWQTLGDAYMRNNQVKDALDCYTRAESLL